RTRSVRTLQREVAEGELDPADAPTAAALQLIDMSTALTNHDRATRGHTERVRAYSLTIGEELGLPEAELEKLRWAAMIHDVGKLKVPAAILAKPGKPTEAEWAELAKHPGYGAEYAEPLRDWLGDWTDVAGQHHENWDGSGYPVGLSGTDISLGARIVAVADAFDVMTSIRSYKDGSPTDEAKAELARCAGTQFDPEVVKAMLEVSIPKRRTGGLAAWLAQIPILGKSWPNSGVMAASVIAAVVATATLTPSGFSPELIAYSNLQTAEDTELRVPVAPAPLPDTVTILEITGPATAVWDGAEIIITGDPNASGEVTVSYRACWGEDCETGSATVTFVPVNDEPQAIVDLTTATGPGPVTIRPLVNDTDLESDELTLTDAEVVRGRAEVAVLGESLIVTPDDDSPQTIDVDYTVTDERGATDRGRARVVIPDFNQAPTAEADQAELPLGAFIVVDGLANDSDPSNDPLQLTGAFIDDAELGSVEVADDLLRFEAGSVTGVATVSYEVTDGSKTTIGTLTVTVTAPPPDPRTDTATTAEDSAVVVPVLANDIALGSSLDPASVSIVSANLGTARALADGRVRFSPAPDAYGIGSVLYQVCNTDGACGTGSVVVEIERVNDAPYFSAGDDVSAGAGESIEMPWATNISVGEPNEPDQSISFVVTTDNDVLFVTRPAITPSGTLTFTAAGTPGSAVVTVRASDGLAFSEQETFVVTITG
ncbi:MAG: Ig-like domain-containing protein, partial [Acidimicrobiales bacterium]